MAIERFGWISRWANLLFNCFPSLDEDAFVRELPDDVIMNILCRLPAEDVRKCQMVCKQWNSLTSSQYFLDLHLSRATPVIWVQVIEPPKISFLIFDGSSKKRKIFKKLSIRLDLKDKHDLRLIGSCDGLLLLMNRITFVYYVLNPVSQEWIARAFADSITRKLMNVHVHGFFFHRLTNQFKMLGLRHQQGHPDLYGVFSFTHDGVEIATINPPLSYYWNLVHRTPGIVNQALHWIVDLSCKKTILVFDMDTQDFSLWPHPGTQCPSGSWHKNMSVSVMDQHLVFCNILCYAKFIVIWMLEDYNNRAWIRRWNLNLDLVHRPLESKSDQRICIDKIQILGVENRELWLRCLERGLFVYNLDSNAVTKIGQPSVSWNGEICWAVGVTNPTRLRYLFPGMMVH